VTSCSADLQAVQKCAVFTTPLAYVLLDIGWFDVAGAMRGQKIYQQSDSGKHPWRDGKHTLNLKQRR